MDPSSDIATSAAQSALSGQDAPVQSAPTAPVAQPVVQQSFFGRLLQGALNGVSGGMRQGFNNMQGAGTPGFRADTSGPDYAEHLNQIQDAAKQKQQDDANQAAQQKFQNDTATYKANQQAHLDAAQTAQTKLSNIHMAQQIEYADQDRQDSYLKDQASQLSEALDNGGQEIDHVTAPPGSTIHDAGAAYIAAHPGIMAQKDTYLSFSKNAEGATEVHVYRQDPNARVDSSKINASMKAIGSDYRVPSSSSMSAHDYHGLMGVEQQKAADNTHAENISKLKAAQDQANEMQKLQYQRGTELSVEKMKEAAANLPAAGEDPTKPLSPDLETLVDNVHSGDKTPSMVTKGMGVKAVQGNRAMMARYSAKYENPKSPDYDPNAQPWEAVEGNYKAAFSDKNTQNVQSAGELLGTKDPKTGKVISQGAVGQMRAKMQHLQQTSPAAFSSGPIARGAAHLLGAAGNPVAEDIMATAPDVAMAYAKFASGGNPSSDATYKATVASIQRARTPAALKAVFDGLDDVAGSRLEGMRQGNPTLGNRIKNINDPGTHTDANNQPTSGTSQGQIPPGMKQQRNKTTGATRLVPIQ